MIATRTLCLLLALLAQPSQAQQRPQPSDFAWRAQIDLPAGASAAQILLPAEAIAQFRSSEREDLRVFNADGEAVTLVWLPQPSGNATSTHLQTASFDALPLMESAAGQAPGKGTVRVQMDANGKTAVWVNLGPAAGSTDKATPALHRLPSVLLDTRKAKQTISALTLDADLPTNMLVHFNLASSTDLVHWTPIALSGPLFRFDGAGAPAASGWTLAVDASNRPLGWLAPGTAHTSGTSRASGTSEALIPGGSLFHAGDPLRNALDAALSSPSGLGVAVDGEGLVAGVVRAEEVLAAIDSARENRS